MHAPQRGREGGEGEGEGGVSEGQGGVSEGQGGVGEGEGGVGEGGVGEGEGGVGDRSGAGEPNAGEPELPAVARMSRLFDAARTGILELLWPQACAGCGARSVSGPFCPPCAGTLEAVPAERCLRCAEPLSGRSWRLRPGPPERAPRSCAACVSGPPPFSTIVAPFVHGGAMATAIHRLKYRGHREVAGVLAPLLVGPAGAALDGVELVAPIPLHATRRRERGYDHALLLAEAAARLAGLTLSPRALTRIRHAAPQVGRSRLERRASPAGAFQAGPAVTGKIVLLVDDVVTTGATARAAAGAARDAGAREVRILALARAG